MTWGIICALDEELRQIKEAMELERSEEVYGLTYQIGSIHGQRIVAVRCSVGTINAAACATVAIQKFGVQSLVNVGIAGSTDKELRVLDVVIADDLVFHDADLDILEKYYPNRRSFPTDAGLRSLAEEAIRHTGLDIRCKTGRIATGDLFVSNDRDKQDIIARCSPLCVEMEGAAIAQIAYMSGIPCLVIRAMSDTADTEAEELYDNFGQLAADNSAKIMLSMLELAGKKAG